MKKFTKIAVRILSLATVACLSLSALFAFNEKEEVSAVGNAVTTAITKVTAPFKNDFTRFFDENVVMKLPQTIASDDEISVIVKMSVDSVMDGYDKTDKSMSISDYAKTDEAKRTADDAAKATEALLRDLDKSGVNYVAGERYDTVLSGFEVTVKAFEFNKLTSALNGKADLIIGETYNKCDYEVVTNYVDVYETGIFDSSDSVYQGDGVVVAVLDTGLDYTHTAFSVDNFTTSDERFTLDNVSGMVPSTTAAGFTHGLTGEDVYVSSKVPYAYDYADKDPDVLPINSEHGTHVAGVIAGKDSEITGVAPNAQLAIMKVFSDTQDGAKTSWILGALEDCVVLGVDVINMSLGTSCGFTREEDEEEVYRVYERIGNAGISLIVAASNSYTAFFSSTKNGTNSKTSNPDYGTVGSPATFTSALSVASVDGVMTPYLLFNDQIMYFNEATTSSAKKKHFVDELLDKLYAEGYISDPDYAEVEYVTIAGLGRSSDYFYDKDYYKGKIALVKRGQTTFEDKIRIGAKEKGAAGVIIYNNISGFISMAAGANDDVACCSISQDDGEVLAAHDTGKLIISRKNVAGPFMSDFSSWGPTSDLRIKPEITAHGGEIYSAVPGQAYDRLSGTSMACPNQAGAAALIRQYVKSGKFGAVTPLEVTAIVNKLMTSTADIVINKNGLPYSVRKQGAGLVNIKHSYQTACYVTTYDYNGVMLDKSKLELGDDKQRTGVYEMTFDVTNVSDKAATYDVGSVVMTDGVSKTYTSHSDTVVSDEGYLLSGAKSNVLSVVGGTQNGEKITVPAGTTAKVTVRVTLSDADKEYINDSFRYGSYVEGYITFEALEGTDVNMNVPMLAYFGDWTEAPIFDEEFYDTNVDELNKGLDDEDKLMPDAYATRVIGGIYSDYISTLGSYYFTQDPSSTQIPASKEHIALSNQDTGETGSTVNRIRDIWAGLLRNVKEWDLSVVEDATGEVVYTKTEYNQKKSWSAGGSVRMSSMDFEFSTLEQNLKNNTSYTVNVTTYIDYGAKEDQKNVRNTFSFPIFIDYQAPVLKDVQFRTEYDRTSKKTSLYADISVFDNHYAMALQLGQIVHAEEGSDYVFTLNSFGKYMTPVYSSYNSTALVTVELTDYIDQIKNSIGGKYEPNGSFSVVENNNCFLITCYDYAMNRATYEVRLPDEVMALGFTEDEIRLSPNETLEVAKVLNIFPSDSWLATLDYEFSDPTIVDVINGTLLAKKSGTSTLTAVGKNANGQRVTAEVDIIVLAPGEEGYNGTYSVPEVSKFVLNGYKTVKAFYKVNNEDRDIGIDGGLYEFGKEVNLKMYPSEKVQLQYTLDTFYPERTSIEYRAANTKVATVDEQGNITAVGKGNTIIQASVRFDGKVAFSRSVPVTVKDPFVSQSIYLMSYYGTGETVDGEDHVVVIPADRGVTMIYAFCFSNYEFVPKDLAAGDVIDKEDPYYIKQWYIGENTIKKVVIPEGVTDIQQYAFANLTALEEVVLPKSLLRIGVGAFEGCTNLRRINLENAKFINQRAFFGCRLEEINLNKVVSIGNYTFAGNRISYVELPRSSQSLGIGAFANNTYLTGVEFNAPRIKIGESVFKNCTSLTSVNINSVVLASSAFEGCSSLSHVTLGKDVAIIGEKAFAGSNVSAFTLAAGNRTLTAVNNGAIIMKGTEVVLAAPQYSGTSGTVTLPDATAIGNGAFSGNTRIRRITANSVKSVGLYAFADCTSLVSVTMNALESVADYAFMNTALTATPNLENVKTIGDYAFYLSKALTSVNIAADTKVGAYAFANCPTIISVTVGDNAKVGDYAFFCVMANNTFEVTQSIANYTQYNYDVKNEFGDVVETYTYLKYNFQSGVFSRMNSLTVGSGVEIGGHAFEGNGKLPAVTFGEDVKVGEYAFYNCGSLAAADMTKLTSVGDYAFSGVKTQQFRRVDGKLDNAFEYSYIDGERVSYDIAFTSFAPVLTSVDLSGVDHLGKGAFSGVTALTAATLNENMDAIPEEAFANTSLTAVDLPEKVTSIGDYAFYGAKLTDVDLTNVVTIGHNAFFNNRLENVTLGDTLFIGNYAFAANHTLSDVTGIEKAFYLGDYAFAECALEKADLSGAVHIGDFAFMSDPLTEVTLGENLSSLGENPFADTLIETFGKTEEAVFDGVPVGKTVIDDYAVSDAVFVSGGALYKRTAAGDVFVSYPTASPVEEFTVSEGTIRISDGAFIGSKIKTVTLPVSLRTIGDKAFFGCDSLGTVVFRSYNAPRLEEKYDKNYATYENISYTGRIALTNGTVYEGLGVVKYYMWNYGTLDCCYFFGANFVDYIGRIGAKMTMVKPKNGENYDTFIMDCYFDRSFIGAAAPMQATVAVVDLINAIPAYVTLDAESLVLSARNAYEALPSIEQKSLVENYGNLLEAEETIEYLKNRDNPNPGDSGDPSGSTDPGTSDSTSGGQSSGGGANGDPISFGQFLLNNLFGLILAVLVGGAFVAYVLITKKKS